MRYQRRGVIRRWGARAATALGALAAALAMTGPALAASEAESVAQVLQALNSDSSVKGTEDSKTYRILFDAYLKLPKPPEDISPTFNLATIHPRMKSWSAVSAWAEGSGDMAKAIVQCKKDKKRKIVGLPYGEDQVDSKYREAGLVAAVAAGGNLRSIDFKYLGAVEIIAAYATAETYRLLEAGKIQEGLDLAAAHLFVLRQFCDRRFIGEKRQAIQMLIDALSNLRDVFQLYQDKITAEQFTALAKRDLPDLMVLRRRLEMPEGDRIVAEALLRSVFDAKDQPLEDRFAETFGAIQASQEPLTMFGAVERWRQISRIHASLPASLKKLELVYDDWWRRWQLLDYEPILDLPTEYARLNPVRYAAVAYAMEPIESLFPLRNQLIASINGTAMAGGLCAYKKYFGNYPNDQEKVYAQFVRKTQSDVDPYDVSYSPFKYKLFAQRAAIDTPHGRIWVEPSNCVLYGRGEDHADNQAKEHSDAGSPGTDVVLWPAIKATLRQAGLLD